MTDFKNEFKAYMTSTYPKATLSNARVDEYVSKLEKRFKEGDEVIDLIKDLDELIGFEQVAKTDDQLRTFQSKEKEKPTQTQTQKEPESVQEPKDETKELLKALYEKVTNLESEKKHESIKSKFFKDERLKGIDTKFLERFTPKDEDSLESEIEAAKTLWDDLKLKSYGGDNPPAGNGSTAKLTDKEIQDRVQKLNKNK